MHHGKLIPALTSLRFFAAFAVVAHHGVGLWNFELSPFLRQFAEIGVSFFFVLSGFVLVWNYSNLNSSERLGFYFKRFLRIYPTHWLITSIYAISSWACVSGFAIASLGKWWLLVLLANLCLLQSWIPIPACYFSYNSPSWSVSCEIFFYILFPFLLLLMRRSRFFPVLLSILFVIGFVILGSFFPLHPSVQTPPIWWQATMNGFVQFSPIVRVFEFCLGMVVGSFALERSLRCQRKDSVQHLEIKVWLLELLSIGIFYYFIKYGQLQGILNLVGLRSISLAVGNWMNHGGSCFVVAFLLYAVSAKESISNIIFRFKPFIILGEASYALYLVHIPFKTFLCEHPNLIAGVSDPAKVAIYFSGSITLSILIWKFWEIPVRKVALQLIKKKI